MSDERWKTVSRTNPCPVCGKPDNCKLSHDESAVWCGRVNDGALRQNGGGQWLHRLKGADSGSPATDWEHKARALALAAGTRRRELADNLGVSAESLDALGVGWSDAERCWTFPERNAAGEVIGLLRRFANGSKKQAAGSPRGLSYADGWQDTRGPVLIVEGGSDTAAGITLGLATIGRPSNRGGADLLIKLLAGLPADREIIVLGEHDLKPDGTWPGRDGAISVAERLAAGLGRSIQWALPPEDSKDLRVWLQAHGHDPDSFLAGLDVQVCLPEPADPMPSWQPFPCDLLPYPIGLYVEEVAAALCCDASYVALPMLAALAGSIGNTRRLRINADWHEPAVVWAITVGESGSLKSPAFDKAMAPLLNRQSAAFAEYERERQQYEQAMLVYEAELEQWKRSRTKDGIPPAEPLAPVPKRFICSDTTMEALTLLLAEQPRGIVLVRDELSGWVRSFDAYRSGRGGDVGHWLSMHRAGAVTMDRKTGRRVIHVRHAAVSICGTIQPAILRLVLGKEHFADGLAARWLLAMPPARPKRYTEAEVPDATKAAVQDVFDRLLSLDFDIDEAGDRQPRDMPLTLDAKQTWAAFVNDFGVERSALTGDLAAAFSKLEAYAARLSLIVHLVRVAASDPSADPNAVDLASVEAGIRLARWFAHETQRLYERLGETEQQAEDRELLELIARKGGSMTPRGLMRAKRQYRASVDEAESALQQLVSAGHGQWRTVGTPGRPRREFLLAG